MANSDLVHRYLIAVSSKLPQYRLAELKRELELLEEYRLQGLSYIDLHDPSMLVGLSFIAGYLGLDRFLIGDIGLGIGKLLTFGGCGIWWFVDLFLISGATKAKNYRLIKRAISIS